MRTEGRRKKYLYVTQVMAAEIKRKAAEMSISESAFVAVAVSEYLRQERALGSIEMLQVLARKEKNQGPVSLVSEGAQDNVFRADGERER